MKSPILNNLKESFFDFIEGHTGEDASDVALKYAGHDLGFPLDFAILQISLRKKCAQTARILKPPIPLSRWHLLRAGVG